MGGLCIYVTYKIKDRFYSEPWKKYGPAILVWTAFPFILADPLRHVLGDQNIWKGCDRTCGELWPDSCYWSSNEYKCAHVCGSIPGQECAMNTGEIVSCTCVHDDEENIHHLSPIGWIFTIFCTWFGFILFIWGSLWNADIMDKLKEIRHKWRVLRGYSMDSSAEDDL